MGLLLGIDIGTSGTKAVLVDEKGKVLASATSEYELLSPRPGWYEQRPLDWWGAVCEATQAVVKKARAKPAAISGIGLSGQMHGSVFLDSKGRVLRPALLWNDQRTGAECADIEAACGGREAVVKLVGNPALTGFQAPKILWLKKNEPKRFELTKQVLLPKDFIRFMMTGEYATDVSDASGTLLLDVARRKWSDEMFAKIKLDKSLVPQTLVEGPDITGKLTKEAADHLGLVPGIPVVGGAGDNAAGAVGNGVVNPGQLASIIGTSGVVFAHSDHVAVDPHGRVHTMCHAVPGKWCVFGCMLSAGGSLQWYRDTLCQDEIAAAKKAKVDPYELLTKAASESPIGGEGLTFLPYLTGERGPHLDPLARGGFIGLTRRTTKAMMTRSVLEGVTFGMRDLLEIIRGLGIPTSSIRATGGGAKSDFWLQVQADIFKAPVSVTTADQGPAYGVAILAGVGTGVWSTVQEACASITDAKTIKPRTREAKMYDTAYGVFKDLYPALKPVFPKMAPAEKPVASAEKV
jgi:xylulokinase